MARKSWDGATATLRAWAKSERDQSRRSVADLLDDAADEIDERRARQWRFHCAEQILERAAKRTDIPNTDASVDVAWTAIDRALEQLKPK